MSTFSVLLVPADESLDFGPEFSVTPASAELARSHQDPGSFDAIVVNDPDLIKPFRADWRTVATPIFTTNDDLADHPLLDGMVLDDLSEVLARSNDRRGSSNLSAENSVEASVANYLWRMDRRRLTPVPDLTRSGIYFYPLFSALRIAGTEDEGLSRAARKGLIEPTGVVDRTRNCKSCNGAHLNYVDRCPHCDNLDIYAEQAIHCFTCGLIADQAAYARGERLVCPKCQTALKHIGTDYDRPIERMRCGDCGERFNDARVKASCLECGTLNAQSELRTHTYRSYKLGASGEDLVRSGRGSAGVAAKFGDALGHEQFLWTLSWLNTMSQTSSDPAVLARIDIKLPPEISDEDTATQTSLLTQIGALLNPSEILHVQTPEIVLILFPAKGAARLNKLVEDVETIAGKQVKDNISLAVEGVQLPRSAVNTDPRQWLESFARRGS